VHGRKSSKLRTGTRLESLCLVLSKIISKNRNVLAEELERRNMEQHGVGCL